MLREGIDEFHALLTDEMAGETQTQLDAKLGDRGLCCGDRPLGRPRIPIRRCRRPYR